MVGKAGLVVLVMVWANCLALDPFVKRYAFKKVISDCYGGDVYKTWFEKAERARQHCYKSPPTTSLTTTTPPSSLTTLGALGSTASLVVQSIVQGNSKPATDAAEGGNQTAHVPLYGGELVRKVVRHAESYVTNFTCVLQRLGYLREDLSLDYAAMEEELKAALYLTPDLRDDYLREIQSCRNLVSCLPLDRYNDKPIYANVKRAIMFMECNKKARLKVCIKHDLKRNLNEYDVSSIEGKEDEVLSKLLMAIWSVEGKDALKVY